MLERLIARDGFSCRDAVEILRTNHGVVKSRENLEKIAARLPTRTRRRFESDEALQQLPSAARTDAGLWQSEDDRVVAGVREKLDALLRALPKEDQLILELRFRQNYKICRIASTLGLKPKSLYRQIDRCLRRLRRELEALGVSRRSVLDALSGASRRAGNAFGRNRLRRC